MEKKGFSTLAIREDTIFDENAWARGRNNGARSGRLLPRKLESSRKSWIPDLLHGRWLNPTYCGNPEPEDA
jgi:hypothetical protein